MSFEEPCILAMFYLHFSQRAPMDDSVEAHFLH